MNLRFLAFALFPLLLTAPAHAESVACPDLGDATQVGACPSEEELQFTFSGYCSDNARLYNWQEEQVCTNYALYRQLKNVALWEAQGGRFQGYLSCDLASDRIKSAKAAKIAVSRQGKMTRVVCDYGDGIALAYRTKAACKVEGSEDCTAGQAICHASCE